MKGNYTELKKVKHLQAAEGLFKGTCPYPDCLHAETASSWCPVSPTCCCHIHSPGASTQNLPRREGGMMAASFLTFFLSVSTRQNSCTSNTQQDFFIYSEESKVSYNSKI